ncbi:hypothetical protein [Pseudoduganella violacea]|uniref:Uncharacterized protein n=1 Tax=Pseudoduganella violacea TaxID=1715466 RepID=A0A7W5B7S2_9BURK|nr:hypothetical protein [Pseudoduganella violacea]MBB3118112.1 hypothetical protein [Pseudoduganella violacea]
MTIDIQTILDSKLAVAVISAIGGGIAGRLAGMLKNRIQELEYTVTHDRVGISANDPVFGSVKAVWNGTELSNLFNSTVTITNTTTKDLKDVVVKVYTGSTKLLTQHVSIKGSTYVPQFTEAFNQATQAPPGGQASAAQLEQYLSSREYKIGTLNRGQQAIFQFLTTEPNLGNSPLILAEIQQEGRRAVFKQTGPEYHGVPARRALAVGLGASLGILIGLNYLDIPMWLSSTVAMCAGLVAASIGAWLYKLAKGAVRFLVS